MFALIELCAGFFLESYKDVIRRGYFEEAKRVVLQITVVLGIVIASLFMTKSSEVFFIAVFFKTLDTCYIDYIYRKSLIKIVG